MEITDRVAGDLQETSRDGRFHDAVRMSQFGVRAMEQRSFSDLSKHPERLV